MGRAKATALTMPAPVASPSRLARYGGRQRLNHRTVAEAFLSLVGTRGRRGGPVRGK